jgi:hypothetical protein
LNKMIGNFHKISFYWSGSNPGSNIAFSYPESLVFSKLWQFLNLYLSWCLHFVRALIL